MIKKFFLLSLISLSLVSCSDHKKKVNPNSSDRPLLKEDQKKQEQKNVEVKQPSKDEIVAYLSRRTCDEYLEIAKDLANRIDIQSKEPLEKYNFKVVGDYNLDDSRIVLIGEHHDNRQDMFHRMAFLKRYAKSNDIILYNSYLNSSEKGSYPLLHLFLDYFILEVAGEEWPAISADTYVKICEYLFERNNSDCNKEFETKFDRIVDLLNFNRGTKVYNWKLHKDFSKFIINEDLEKRLGPIELRKISEEIISSIRRHSDHLKDGRIFMITDIATLPSYEFQKHNKDSQYRDILLFYINNKENTTNALYQFLNPLDQWYSEVKYLEIMSGLSTL